MPRPPAKDVGGYYVYMLECSDSTIYTGSTKDPSRRVAQHNDGKGAKYTRGRRPVSLVYLERAGSKEVALRRESAIKKLSRSAKLLLCSQQAEVERRAQ
jgi:putative endonuclease